MLKHRGSGSFPFLKYFCEWIQMLVVVSVWWALETQWNYSKIGAGRVWLLRVLRVWAWTVGHLKRGCTGWPSGEKREARRRLTSAGIKWLFFPRYQINMHYYDYDFFFFDFFFFFFNIKIKNRKKQTRLHEVNKLNKLKKITNPS